MISGNIKLDSSKYRMKSKVNRLGEPYVEILKDGKHYCFMAWSYPKRRWVHEQD